MNYAGGSVAIAHNGNLVNFSELRARLEDEGSIFQTTSDTELILHLIARSREGGVPERLADALRAVRGAYSLAVLTPNELIAVRDPMGIRPLSLGRVRGRLGGGLRDLRLRADRGRVRARRSSPAR